MTIRGLRQFLDDDQQRAWLNGEANPRDTNERSESFEQRFKYAARFEKLLDSGDSALNSSAQLDPAPI